METISFSNISVKFFLKIDDLEVAAGRRWDPNPHVRPNLADAWLWWPICIYEVGLEAVDCGLWSEVSFYSHTLTSESKSFAFSSTSPLLLTLPAENTTAPLGGHPVQSRASIYP